MVSIQLTDEQVAQVVKQAGLPPVVVNPPSTGGENPPAKIDGVKVNQFRVSVDPQRTILGSTANVITAIQVVTPSQLDPHYQGSSPDALGTLLSIFEYGGQAVPHVSAVVNSFSDPIVWSGGSNVHNVEPNQWVLYKPAKNPRFPDKPDAPNSMAIKCYPQ